jgi:hypothetical protein
MKILTQILLFLISSNLTAQVADVDVIKSLIGNPTEVIYVDKLSSDITPFIAGYFTKRRFVRKDGKII